MDNNDLVDVCLNSFNSKINNLNTLNIVIVGKSGVGKSTLVNSVFRKNMAATGIGSPVTQHMQRYTKSDIPLTIYDTKGFELGKKAQQEVKEELLKTIREGINSRDINKAIHCIWYCVSVPSNRFEEEEIEWIRDFTERNKCNQTPMIIVLTQAFSKQNAQSMMKEIEAKNLNVIQIIPVLAQDYEFDEICVKAYGVKRLLKVMEEALPEELINTLENVQQVNLSMKQKKSQKYVVEAAASAAAVAAVNPIPVSDAMGLIPVQVAMLTRITAIFGFKFNKSVLTGLISTVFGSGSATLAGRMFVSYLLKLIPGAGTVAGGVISGATASMLTMALGEAYIGIMTAIYHGELKESELLTREGQEKLGRLYKHELLNFKRKK